MSPGILISTSIPSPTFASPVHPQTTMPPAPEFHTPTLQIQASPSMPSIAGTGLDGSTHVDLPQGHNSSEAASAGQREAAPSLASHTTNTPQHSGENVSPTVPSKPQPKRVRRAELSEELIARDLNWFKANQNPQMVKKDHNTSSPNVSEASPTMLSDAPHVPGQSPWPKKKTFRMVPSRRIPRRVPLHTTQEVESGVSASEPLAEKGESCENAREVPTPMDVDEQNPSLERTESDSRFAAVPEASNVQEGLQPEGLPSSKPPLSATTLNEPSAEPQVPLTDHQPSSDDSPLTNGEILVSPRLHLPCPGTASDRMESMDIADSESLPSESPSKPEWSLPQSPRMLRMQSPILPVPVNALDPPLNLNFKISPTSPNQPQQPAIDGNQRRFDDEMTVIHSTQGKPFTHIHIIEISLNESTFSKIFKWVRRKSHPSYVADCLDVERN